MRRSRWFAFSLALAAVLAPGSPTWAAPHVAEIVRTAGTVKIWRSEREGWHRVITKADHLLDPGNEVQTLERSAATIEYGGARKDLRPRTRIAIPKPSGVGKPKGASVWVIAGRIFVWLIGGRDIEVGTAAAVAGASGTKFAVEIGPDGAATVTVVEGEVSFYNELGSVTVGVGEQSTARPGSAPTRPMAVDISGYIQWEASLHFIQAGYETLHNPSILPDQLQDAATEARQRAEAAPDDVAAQLRAGDALHDAGDLIGAEEAYHRAIELAPGEPEAYTALGHTLLANGRPEEARAAFEQAAEIAPGTAAPLAGQALARVASGEPEVMGTAAEPAQRAIDVEPESALAHTVAGLLAVRRGEAEEARGSLERAIGLDPSAYQAHSYLALVALAQGDVPVATEAAGRAVELAPGSGPAHESLATVHFFAGDLDGARREVDLALEISPTSPRAHLILSDILVAQGDLDGGLRAAQTSVALDPSLAPAHAALGMIALAQNDLPLAEKSLAEALVLSPELIAARAGMGVLYSRQGKLAQAMASQKAAIALDPQAAATHNNLGVIHLAQGRLNQALSEFQTAIDLQPDWSMPHANRAIAYLDLNRFADAVREGELAVRLGENSARVHTTLARVYLEQNRVNKAWAALRRALELDNSYALAHLQLAEVFLRQGRARDAWREQLEGIVLQPSAILESREYARTEARAEIGNHLGRLRTDGRADDGLTSYFASVEHEASDWGRPRTDWHRTTALGILGRQPSAHRTAALLFSTQDEGRERPGRALAARAPEDADYQSSFDGREAHFLARMGNSSAGRLAVKLGFRSSCLEDCNPDSLRPDPKPARRLRTRLDGPIAEARLDKNLSPRHTLTAGVAVSGEEREVSGVMGTLNPPAAPRPITWTPFSNEVQRNAATFYVEHEQRIGSRTRLMLGGRMATAEDTTPVIRPKASLRHQLGSNGTLVLLTRPVLRDDVSEISPVDYWALRHGLSPLDFSAGGFAQSWELQYQLMPTNGSLLRVSAFHRSLRNLIVDLQDPAWAPGETGVVLDSATLRGVEAEWEQWLTRDLSAGAWVRYADSENQGSGNRDVPMQPRLLSQVRLDYIGESGLRAGLRWAHVGTRYADMGNVLKLPGYDVVDLSAAYQVDLHTDVLLFVDNVFDNRDGLWADYPDRGRRIRGGIEYRF